MSHPTPLVAASQLNATDLNDFTLSKVLTFGATIAALDAIRVGGDGKIYQLVGDTLANATGFIGFAAEAGNNNDTKRIVPPGQVLGGFSGLTPNAYVYITNAGGVISSTPGTIRQVVGWAITSSTILILDPAASKIKVKFGGTGADGALALTSGVTNIDVGGSAFYIKNYSSISITGTGQLTFSNPHANGTIVLLRSQGDVTLTSSAGPNIDVSGMGAIYGAKGNPANDGSNPSYILDGGSHFGIKGGAITGGGAGAAYTYTANMYALSATLVDLYRTMNVVPGAGGGGGNSGAGVGGNGGRGGGGLIIECGGAWNFTSTIWAKGNNGADATGSTANGAAGGGGGSRGAVVVLYNYLTANSGVITTTGGSGGGGTGGSSGGHGGGGGGAGSYEAAGGAGGAEGNSPGGSGSAAAGVGAGGGGGGAGVNAGANGGGGGAGGASAGGVVAQNNVFA